MVGGWIYNGTTQGDPKQPEGAWPVCSDTFADRRNKCVVYSFGINDDFSFDDEVAETYGCQVHAFDPTMKVETYQRSKKVMFWNVGVANRTLPKSKEGWNVSTVKDLMTSFGHKKIDLIKMDIEGNEWPVLQDWIEKTPEVLWATDQLDLEIHLELDDMIAQADLIRRLLEDFDYQIWGWHVNPKNPPLELESMGPMMLSQLLEIAMIRALETPPFLTFADDDLHNRYVRASLEYNYPIGHYVKCQALLYDIFFRGHDSTIVMVGPGFVSNLRRNTTFLVDGEPAKFELKSNAFHHYNANLIVSGLPAKGFVRVEAPDIGFKATRTKTRPRIRREGQCL
ncbi:hypothetical protein SmJEL517_g02714 [Synchytrium microbalum]|uniref:Methyltransferase domain-containing protein n=1 Tax=Synchytrium microbalum TaxID=1806994 RepID=A0A507C6J7_9FUNG|nr:uncharacterized protein SmJEL517_g02714 [Synchytrium microbalum]TPX34739.1 hypothetical protein SmJEL517_g02714 [Synchytrium microbalum]